MYGGLILSFLAVSQSAPILPPPKVYVCRPALTPISLDGRLDGAAWNAAPFTDDFVDIEGAAKPKPRFRTRAKMLWDREYLYIGAEIEEPHVRATLTQHDSVIFHDNDFEVFLDPNGEGEYYAELEMNALNTSWDLLLPRPYRSGGPALNGWDIKGLKTAVRVEGNLNGSRSPTRGWTVVVAIPWTALSEICRCACPPRDGDQWRINFSRVEWPTRWSSAGYETIPGRPEDNWVWSPQGVIDMHRPDRWGVLQFTSRANGVVPPKPLEGWSERQILVRIWDAQSVYRRRTGAWADSPSELGVSVPGLRIFTTPDQFEAILGVYRINERLRLWEQK